MFNASIYNNDAFRTLINDKFVLNLVDYLGLSKDVVLQNLVKVIIIAQINLDKVATSC